MNRISVEEFCAFISKTGFNDFETENVHCLATHNSWAFSSWLLEHRATFIILPL